MSKVTDPSFKFWYDDNWYTVQGAETMERLATPDDMRAMRAEYTRMRDVAQKRLKRLEKEFPESKASKHYYDTGKVDSQGRPIMALGFQKLKNLDPRDFAKAFSELAKFVRAKGSTVTGQREMQRKTMKTLNTAIGAVDEEGNVSGGVTKENYWRVIKILEEARRQKITYDSDKIVALAETTLPLNNDQFDDVMDSLSNFLENVEEVGSRIKGYMTDRKINDYQRVDIKDFKEITGW